MLIRLSLLITFVVGLAACNTEERQDTDTSEAKKVPLVGSASELPPEHRLFSVAVFSEDTLDRWGYITTEIANEYHAIRSKRNYGNADEAFYARFHLEKAEFGNASAASETKDRIEALLKSEPDPKNRARS